MTVDKIKLFERTNEASDLSYDHLLKSITHIYSLQAKAAKWAPGYEVRVVDSGATSAGLLFIKTEIWGHYQEEKKKIHLWTWEFEGSICCSRASLRAWIHRRCEVFVKEHGWDLDYKLVIVDSGLVEEGRPFVKAEMWGYRLGDEA